MISMNFFICLLDKCPKATTIGKERIVILMTDLFTYAVSVVMDCIVTGRDLAKTHPTNKDNKWQMQCDIDDFFYLFTR